MISAANVKTVKENTKPYTYILIKTITTFDTGSDLFDFDNTTYSVMKHRLHDSGVLFEEHGMIDLFDGKHIAKVIISINIKHFISTFS